MEWLVFVGLITMILVLILFARHMKHSKSQAPEMEIDDTDIKHPIVEGNLIEYRDFFLKADKQGYVQTLDGDLSIECFQSVGLEVQGEPLSIQLENSEQEYIKTSRGEIHRNHFVPKG